MYSCCHDQTVIELSQTKNLSTTTPGISAYRSGTGYREQREKKQQEHRKSRVEWKGERRIGCCLFSMFTTVVSI